ncbi:12502_t:CDS:2 [Cetraspora pellucida]|uniref:12502_t:CDS:1 n=1 Tax=Cetraspora pellucida TaxID=1433469 RepID=A0ACA9M2N1_9GLOM|nr:12502_t:CDS:2 [Cetraspora pellucida]
MTGGESSKEASIKVPEETPSRMLRQLSRALVQPALDQHLTPLRQRVGTPKRQRVSTPRTPRTRQTPIIHLTPNSTRRSLRRQSKEDKSKTKKKQTPQNLLRVLSRAPGFVQKSQIAPDVPGPSNIEIKDVETEKNNIEIEDIEPEEHQIKDIEPEEQRHILDNDNDDITNVYSDQATDTMEFTGEFKIISHDMNTDTNIYNDQEHRHILDYENDDITNVYSDQATETMEFTGEFKSSPHDINVDTNIYNDQVTEIMECVGEINNNPIEIDDDDENDVQNQEQRPKNKRLFGSFSNAKLSKTAMQVNIRTQLFFEQVATDLATYAAHGKREIIQDKDVLLLMKRQGLINDKISFEYLADRYLPRELSDEVCLVARAGNKLYP